MKRTKYKMYNKKYFYIMTVAFIAYLVINIILVINSKEFRFVGVTNGVAMIYCYVLGVTNTLNKRAYIKKRNKDKLRLYIRLSKINDRAPVNEKQVQRIRCRIEKIKAEIETLEMTSQKVESQCKR